MSWDDIKYKDSQYYILGIPELKARNLLIRYSEFLHKHNYMADYDWIFEEPDSIERYIDEIKENDTKDTNRN